MRTQGYVSLAPYVTGINKSDTYYPGYRAEFMATVDMFRFKQLILTGIVGNETLINRADTVLVKLDRIHYIVSPGFRIEFKKWLVKGSYHHESINRIDHEEILGGAYWTNSFRLGAGSKGSSYLYLPEEYMKINNLLLNSIDVQADVGVFLHGSESIWVAKNHDYRYEFLGLVRYHLGIFRNWAIFMNLRQHLWITQDDSVEEQYKITINFFKKGSASFFGLYYTHTVYDNTTIDNEDGMGAVGMKIIF